MPQIEASVGPPIGGGNPSPTDGTSIATPHVRVEFAMKSRQTDKAVVLAAGLGTRMRRPDASTSLDERQAAAAQSGVKALIPIVGVGTGRPFLDYVLSALAEAGYRRICLVVGPAHDALRDYCQQLRTGRLRIELAVQQEPRGTADAVLAAEWFSAGDAFAVLNSDNYYPVEALRALREQPGSAVALFDRQSMFAGSNVSAERLSSFAVARVDRQGLLQEIIEKPDEAALASLPEPIWVSMNCWKFGTATSRGAGIFEACRAIGPSPRGEFEIPAAVQYAIDVLEVPFRVVRVKTPVLDLSGRNDIAPVAAKLAAVEVKL